MLEKDPILRQERMLFELFVNDSDQLQRCLAKLAVQVNSLTAAAQSTPHAWCTHAHSFKDAVYLTQCLFPEASRPIYSCLPTCIYDKLPRCLPSWVWHGMLVGYEGIHTRAMQMYVCMFHYFFLSLFYKESHSESNIENSCPACNSSSCLLVSRSGQVRLYKHVKDWCR